MTYHADQLPAVKVRRARHGGWRWTLLDHTEAVATGLAPTWLKAKNIGYAAKKRYRARVAAGRPRRAAGSNPDSGRSSSRGPGCLER